MIREQSNLIARQVCFTIRFQYSICVNILLDSVQMTRDLAQTIGIRFRYFYFLSFQLIIELFVFSMHIMIVRELLHFSMKSHLIVMQSHEVNIYYKLYFGMLDLPFHTINFLSNISILYLILLGVNCRRNK